MKAKKLAAVVVEEEESNGFLKGAAGIAERKRTADQFFGIVEGGTPCFVYREKNRRSGSKSTFIFLLLLLFL